VQVVLAAAASSKKANYPYQNAQSYPPIGSIKKLPAFACSSMAVTNEFQISS